MLPLIALVVAVAALVDVLYQLRRQLREGKW